MKPHSFMSNSWEDVLFFHWPVPQHILRACVPDPLLIDTMDGQAWVSIVPFAMRNIRMRGFPRIPWAHALLECNVRTYVTYHGVPGVWFVRLDADHALAVWFGRTIASLPYAFAHIEQHHTEHALRYVCGPQQFDATAAAQGPYKHAVPGSLDHWLCERYFLYTRRRNTLYRGRVIHPPWC
ncbi:MAG: DUF2071 domain-containing protein, partial [Paenibacillaceae bacterium]|nr:DUF2071 domain-containing protein [Paenibacillaceae bacterium]